MGREVDERRIKTELNKKIKAVKEFMSKIHIKIEKAILFGSWVTGDWMEWSDVDLILVSPDFKAIKFPKRPPEIIGFWDYSNGALQVFCYTPEEFNIKRKQIGLVADAEKTGIVIKG